MILIVGLGNPGYKYKKTRHNIGFMVIDAFVKNYESGIMNHEEKFNASIWKIKSDTQKLFLVKPLMLMNESGKSIKSIIHNSSFMIQDMIVIHDDSDLSLGTIKISQDVGSAGHKGIQSIIDQLKTQDFTRIRIGIRPTIYPGPRKKSGEFVLKKFAKEEKEMVKKVIGKAVEIIEQSLKEKIKPTTINI